MTHALTKLRDEMRKEFWENHKIGDNPYNEGWDNCYAIMLAKAEETLVDALQQVELKYGMNIREKALKQWKEFVGEE